MTRAPISFVRSSLKTGPASTTNVRPSSFVKELVADSHRGGREASPGHRGGPGVSWPVFASNTVRMLCMSFTSMQIAVHHPRRNER